MDPGISESGVMIHHNWYHSSHYGHVAEYTMDIGAEDQHHNLTAHESLETIQRPYLESTGNPTQANVLIWRQLVEDGAEFSPQRLQNTDHPGDGVSQFPAFTRPPAEEMARLRVENQRLQERNLEQAREIARLRAGSATRSRFVPTGGASGQSTAYVESRRSTARSSGPPLVLATPEARLPRAPNGPPNHGLVVSSRTAAAAACPDQRRPHRAALHARQCTWRIQPADQSGDQPSRRQACFRCRKHHEKCTFSSTYTPCACCERCRTAQSTSGPNPALWEKIGCRATSVMDLCPELVLCKDTKTSPHKLLENFQHELLCPSYRSHESLSNDILSDLQLESNSWWIPKKTNDFGESILSRVIGQAFEFEQRQGVKSPLVLVALLCFQGCQNCLVGDSLSLLGHSGICDEKLCRVDKIEGLAKHLAIYLNELNTVLRDSDNLDNTRCLSAVYSLFIMGYVQRGLQVMEDRYLPPDRPTLGASKHYLNRILALFGAMEKEDTLFLSKKPFAQLRRKSDSGSDRSMANALFTKDWKRLDIRTTYQFLERHMNAVCNAYLGEPSGKIHILSDQHLASPIYGADMDAFSIMVPSMTNASTSGSTMPTPFHSPSIAASNLNQVSFTDMDFSLDDNHFNPSSLVLSPLNHFASPQERSSFGLIAQRSSFAKSHGTWGWAEQTQASTEGWELGA